jgi:hypothetical protein
MAQGGSAVQKAVFCAPFKSRKNRRKKRREDRDVLQTMEKKKKKSKSKKTNQPSQLQRAAKGSLQEERGLFSPRQLQEIDHLRDLTNTLLDFHGQLCKDQALGRFMAKQASVVSALLVSPAL